MEHGQSIRGSMRNGAKSWFVLVRVLVAILAVGFIATLGLAGKRGLNAQTAAPRPASPAGPAAAPATPPPQALASSNPEFLKAADEVLSQMSEILHLPIKEQNEQNCELLFKLKASEAEVERLKGELGKAVEVLRWHVNLCNGVSKDGSNNPQHVEFFEQLEVAQATLSSLEAK